LICFQVSETKEYLEDIEDAKLDLASAAETR